MLPTLANDFDNFNSNETLMKEEYIKWHSNTLNREMEMLIYGHAGLPIIFFPTTMGRYYESKDFKLIESVRHFIDNGKVRIYCPDSMDKFSWYNRSAHPAQKVQVHDAYDRMIMNEVISHVQYATGYGKVAVAGASFGGYHALNFGFRHPHSVSHIISMSGAFDIRTFLGGYYDDSVYFHNPVDFIPNLNDPEVHQLKIIIGTSEWDICKGANEAMHEILNKKGIAHWFDMRGWLQHDWQLWRDMFPHYISVI